MEARGYFYAETRPSFRWTILVLCWWIYFCFGLINITLSVIVSPVSIDLGLSYSQMGFILGTWQLVYTVVAVPLGFFIDRIGTYKSLLIAMGIVSLSGILRSFAGSFETMVIFVGLFGIGGCMVSIGIPKVASIWFLGKERSTAVGVYSTAGPAGSIAALSLTNTVVMPLVGNWRAAYLVYGAIGLTVALVWLILGRASPGRPAQNAADFTLGKMALPEIRQAFTRNVLIVILIGITSFLVAHGIMQWLPTILQAKGMTAAEAGFAVSMMSLFMIFGSLLATRLPYLLGSKRIAIYVLLSIQGISLLIISKVAGPILWTFLAFIGISGGFIPLLSMILMDLPEVGPERMGMVGGFFFAIGEIGGFGGPAAIGLFKDLTGTFLWGLIFLAAICGTMIIPAVFLKVDKNKTV